MNNHRWICSVLILCVAVSLIGCDSSEDCPEVAECPEPGECPEAEECDASLADIIAQFVGTWNNTDPATTGITKVIITATTVQMWGSCTPTDCDWGTTTFSVISEDRLSIVWDPGFVIRTQTLTLRSNGELEIVSVSRYTDGTANVTHTYTFTK